MESGLTLPSQSNLSPSVGELTASTNNVSKALDFEVSQRAAGQTKEDSFYAAPSNTQGAAPGTLLKVERVTNVSLYTIPPGLSMSRFVYQSQTPDSKKVPVSAYVLWPYTARPHTARGLPFLAWAHGASGITPKAAPSGIRNLWQHFLAPYQFALNGYVVVATDYKGLGVGTDAAGNAITHEWVNGPDQAEDVYWSVPAARTAFSELSDNFVVVGHSQGGGAAWGVAEKMAAEPMAGHLGTIAGTPATRWLDCPSSDVIIPLGTVYMAPGIATHALPGSFKPADILTSAGVKALETLQQLQGANAVAFQLVAQGEPLLKPDWKDNKHVQAYQELAAVGRKRFRGPMLVTQGDADPIVEHAVTANVVEETARLCPGEAMEYHTLRGISHNPSMPAALQIWLDWIAQRFAGVAAAPGLRSFATEPVRPVSATQPEVNWVIELQRYSWQSE